MNYLSDLHTHTIISGHAYSTLLENVDYCAKNNIKILGTSDHGPKMPGAPHYWYFGNLKVVPREINGVTILKGAEANILDVEGNIDIPSDGTKCLDYLIASFHEPIFPMELSKEEKTQAILNVIEKNELIEILGHLGNPNYVIDYRAVLEKAKEKDIMIEINNSSLLGNSRRGSEDNCKAIALLCKEIGNKVILSSDAHICFLIGKFDKAIEMLESIDFPEELIMNNPDKLISHFKNKSKLQDI